MKRMEKEGQGGNRQRGGIVRPGEKLKKARSENLGGVGKEYSVKTDAR